MSINYVTQPVAPVLDGAPPTTQAVGRLDAYLGSVVSVSVFGAVADGVTDNTAAVTAAIASGAKALHFPAADLPYYFAPTAGASSGIDPGSVVKIFGDGIGRSILQYNEGTDASPRRLFYRAVNNPGYDATTLRDPLVFEDIEFRGTWSSSDSIHRGGECIALDGYKEIRFHRCRWKNISKFATDLHFNNRVIWDHCEWEDVARDQARARDSFYTSVTNCVFRRGGDDAVAWHTAAYNASYNPDNGDPRREGLFVKNNYFVDCSVAVAALGARVANISDNTVVRGRGSAVYIADATAEGVHPMFQIRVQNNTIIDRADASANPAIYVSCDDQRSTASSSNVIPGSPANTTGAFQKPWDYNNSDSTDAADALPPLADVIVSGNVIGRTLPTVSNYIDWGFGYGGKLDSNPYNPAITNAGMRWSVGIHVKGGFRVRICDNMVSHTSDAIYYVPPGSLNPSSLAGMIANNSVFDCTGRMIYINGSTVRRTDLVIQGNYLNGDYYRESSNSNADGTYDNQNTAPTAIDLGGNECVVVTNNVIQNVARVVSATTFGNSKWNNNTLICDPVAVGASASNKGIGNVPNITEDFKVIVVDCDTTSATFGQIKNVCLERANSQPTTGTYLQNMLVKNGNVVLATGKVTYGWIRLTTGTGHVNGTDWTPLVIPNT